MGKTKIKKEVLPIIKEEIFFNDEGALEYYNQNLKPLVRLWEKYTEKIYDLLKTCIDESKFPDDIKKYYKKLKSKKHNDRDALTTMSLFLDTVKDHKVIEKYNELRKKRANTREQYRRCLNVLEREHHCTLLDLDPRKSIYIPGDPIECLTLSQVQQGSISSKYFKTHRVDELSKYSLKKFVDNNYLFLQVDLSYDKEEIRKACDDIVSKVQKITGKNKVTSASIHTQIIFNQIFQKNYFAVQKQTEAIQNTINELHMLGIELQEDAIRKTYYRAFKKEKGIKDIRELLKGENKKFLSRGK